MSETTLAKRYAKSLLDIGKENNLVDQLLVDVKFLIATSKANRQLAAFFRSPVIGTVKKNAVIKGLFEGKINKITFDFLLLINAKNREFYLTDIGNAFIDLYRQYKHEQIAWLTTAVVADAETKQQMINLIGKTTTDKIELREIVDPSIIGGFILRWGDHQLDASVTNKLHGLRQEFKENLFQKEL